MIMSMLSTLKRFGITTGATAAASAKASVIYLFRNETPKSVTIPTPIGLRLEIAVDNYERRKEEYCATVTKFSGDNPDVLNGLKIVSCSRRCDSGIFIEGGNGIGVVTKPGLKVEVGEKAINPIAKQMIIDAIKEVTLGGVKVRIEVPDGEKIAELTMNKDVGVINGISILGTTGIEYPVSDDEYLEHIKSEICVVRALGNKKLILAPGNTSFEFARKHYGDNVVKIGDRVGDSIRLAIEQGFTHIVLVSLPGKITKVASGLMNTHSKYGDARIETLTHAAVLAKLNIEKVEKIANSATVTEAITYLSLEERKALFGVIAKRVLQRLKKIAKNGVKLGVSIISEEGEVLAEEGDL
ncbi:cobalt-precorrin-5B (C(1))-methyltransferase [Sulfolobus sp. S-194]|nr:cobalt-precorrin-5B (C(1))-methyltransferase [Sulfolobus sp. S-194]